MRYDAEFQVYNGQWNPFPIVHIRRLYHVIFLNENLREFDLFTGAVFRPLNMLKQVCAIPPSFGLTFRIGIPREAYLELRDQGPQRITDCLSTFRDEELPWRGLWSGACKPQATGQMLGHTFEKFFHTVGEAKAFGLDDCCVNAGLPLDDIASLSPNESPVREFLGRLVEDGVVLLRGDPGTDRIEKLSLCLPTVPAHEATLRPLPRDDAPRGFLEFSVHPQKQVPRGCDLISWTHVNIPICRRRRSAREWGGIVDHNINFEWSFATDRAEYKPRSDEFMCDQMRAYIIPPPHQRLDEPGAMLERGPTNIRIDDHENTRYERARNALETMVSDGSYYFRSWKDKYGILSRTVYRVRGSYFEESGSNDYWSFRLRSAVVRAPGLDAALIYAILIPVIAAFGVDHNRLAEIKMDSLSRFGNSHGLSILGFPLGFSTNGVFPYFDVFEPLHAWVIFLLAFALQSFLDKVWRNTRLRRPLVFSISKWVINISASFWFLPVFIVGVNYVPAFVGGAVVQASWTFSTVLPLITYALAFIFYAEHYHFSGFGQAFRVRLTRWLLYHLHHFLNRRRIS